MIETNQYEDIKSVIATELFLTLRENPLIVFGTTRTVQANLKASIEKAIAREGFVCKALIVKTDYCQVSIECGSRLNTYRYSSADIRDWAGIKVLGKKYVTDLNSNKLKYLEQLNVKEAL